VLSSEKLNLSVIAIDDDILEVKEFAGTLSKSYEGS
jgi:hypothetical protein